MDYLDIHTHHTEPRDGQKAIYNLLWPFDPNESIRHEWVSAGLHPWYFSEADVEEQLEILENRSEDKLVKLIGECGFDRLKGAPIAVQRRAFERQAQLAVDWQKPITIHCVRAFDELIPYGKRFATRIPMIVHGFNKSPILGKQLLKHGFLLSFGAGIMNEGSGAAQTLQDIDAPFFLETDDSQLGIDEIYHRAAFLRRISVDELKDVIFAAWKKINII